MRSKSSRKTPLIIAVKKGYIQIIENLIENGADLNEVDGKGRSPIDVACKNNQVHTLQLLLKAGANVKDDKNSFNSLHFAVSKEKDNLTFLLLNYG